MTTNMVQADVNTIMATIMEIIIIEETPTEEGTMVDGTMALVEDEATVAAEEGGETTKHRAATTNSTIRTAPSTTVDINMVTAFSVLVDRTSAEIKPMPLPKLVERLTGG